MRLSLARIAQRAGMMWSPRSTDSGLTLDRRHNLGRELEAEKAALTQFTSAMEEEFLELGALLRKIMSLASQVRLRSTDIVTAASGGAEDAAIQFAFQLLKKAEDLVRAGREQHHKAFSVLEKMHLGLLRVAKERGALMRTLAPLETTNAQFRIQATAFDEITREQFFGLSDDIRKIVMDVKSAVGRRFEELEHTGNATGELARQLIVEASEQDRETEAILADSRSNLVILSAALLDSEATAQSISRSGEKIANGVDRAIVALQCQDMARQKILHINAAIDDMVSHLRSAATNKLTRAEEADCGHFLYDAGQVQLGQLNAVFLQLEEAATAIESGSNEVAVEAKAFTDHALRSGSATLDGQIIQKTIQSLHAALDVIDSAVSSVRSVSELIDKLKSTFSDCTSQILGLALGLRLVALNAQVFAAHVDAGTSLEVLARHTGSIADQAMHQLGEISTRVAELVDLVIDLDQQLDDYRQLADIEQNQLAREAAQSETKLLKLDRELRAAVAGIAPLEQQLARTTEQTVACIRFPKAVAQARARSTALFEKIVRQYSDSRPTSGAADHQKVRDLKRNYTMEHERDVHESAVAQVRAPNLSSKPITAAALEDNDEALADNVELF